MATLYAALTWIDKLLKKYPDTTDSAHDMPVLPIPIDNKSVINDIHWPITELTLNFQLLTPDYNIIQALHHCIPTLPIPLNIFHVKAHQDEDKPLDKLTPYAQLSVLVDQYAEHQHQWNTSSIGPSQLGYQELHNLVIV